MQGGGAAQVSQSYEGEDGQRNQNKRKGVSKHNYLLLTELMFLLQRDDINMAIAEAKRFIVNDQYEEANKIVYDTMNLTIKQKIFNEKSIELLPAYFILAEANIGMGGAKLKKAEEFLIAANWNLLKSGQSGPGDDGRAGGDETLVTREELDSYNAALNITFGRLFMAQNRPNAHEKALEKLTAGIY